MQPSVILLLHADTEIALVSNLQQVLQAGLQHGVGSLRNVEIVSKQIAFDDDVPRAFSGLNVSLVLLVLSSEVLSRSAEIFGSIKRLSDAPIIVVNESRSADEVFESIQNGASDFIAAPINGVNVLPRVRRLLESASSGNQFEQSLKQEIGLKRLIGESPAFVSQMKRVAVLAKCDVNVLIMGETGTGKELCARFIHYMSARSNGPFIPVNCGAIPTDLVENEFFGHERGAYTGASKSHDGLIHDADGGTLFLDEIDSLPLAVQVKLLRFLQEKEYRALGSTKTCTADVRIIAATNMNLESGVRSGKIREDFYYRISVMSVALPPLRNRPEDIPLLTRHFLAKYAKQYGKRISGIAPDALQMLMLYDWPGNVRQLEHVIEGAIVLCDEAALQAAHVVLPQQQAASHELSFREMKAKVVDEFEKTYIKTLLLTHYGNISRAALAAKKDRRTFFQLMRKHKINPQTFKPASL